MNVQKNIMLYQCLSTSIKNICGTPTYYSQELALQPWYSSARPPTIRHKTVKKACVRKEGFRVEEWSGVVSLVCLFGGRHQWPPGTGGHQQEVSAAGGRHYWARDTTGHQRQQALPDIRGSRHHWAPLPNGHHQSPWIPKRHQAPLGIGHPLTEN